VEGRSGRRMDGVGVKTRRGVNQGKMEVETSIGLCGLTRAKKVDELCMVEIDLRRERFQKRWYERERKADKTASERE
jgi:hypothetical protein